MEPKLLNHGIRLARLWPANRQAAITSMAKPMIDELVERFALNLLSFLSFQTVHQNSNICNFPAVSPQILLLYCMHLKLAGAN